MILTHLIFLFFNQYVRVGNAITSNIEKFTSSCSDFVKYKSKCFDNVLLIASQSDFIKYKPISLDQHNFKAEVLDEQFIFNR